MTVIAKFKVSSIIPFGESGGATVQLFPVYSEDPNHENRRFWTATPSGNIQMNINNPDAVKLFEEGQEYYVEFTPAE